MTKDIILHPELVLLMETPPAPRPRITKKGISYYPKEYTQFKNEASFRFQGMWKNKESIKRAIEIELFFLVKKPKSKIRKTTANHRSPCYKTRGDLDNRIKSVLDVLQDSGIIHNDSQIYSIKAEAWFAGVQENEKTSVRITEVLKAKWVKL